MNEAANPNMEHQTTPSSQKGNNMMPVMIVGALIVLAVLGYGAYRIKRHFSHRSAQTSSQTEMTAASPTDNSASSSATPADGSSSDTPTTNDERVITMDAGSFYYKPNVITAKLGEKLKVVITSKDMVHNFNIDELNVHSPMIHSGETNSVEFVASKQGTFEFYCSVGQHRAHGQVGKITIE